jgi:exopolysaccharide biosynthesis polyprenyl glycosylphosphotransferase
MFWQIAPHTTRHDRDERLLFVGVSSLIVRLIDEIGRRPELRWRVVGLVADRRGPEAPGVGPWLGPIADLERIVAATRASRILVAPAARRQHGADRALLDAHLRGVPVEDAAERLEELTGKLPIERLTPRSILRGGGFRHSDLTSADATRHAARILSFVGATLGLVLFGPLLALVAIAIRLDSRGPVLFVQPRVGVGGRPFNLLKFRTMHVTPAQVSEWVSDNGHRITRVGRWLRRFRIDELPQLANVVAGDMNLVGPRPHPASNFVLFDRRIPHYRLRTTVRPGITGWAQVRYGYANGLDEETEKMRYDLYYIKHRSLWLDLRILVETAWVVLVDHRSHERAERRRPARPMWHEFWSKPSRQAGAR